jgi:hypothetical protein
MRTYLPKSFSPRVEALESRMCLACTIAADDDTLTIRGDDAANAVTLTLDGAGGVAVVCDGGTAQQFDDIKEIDIRTRGGDDTVTLTATGELTKNLELNLNLGDGNDVADLKFAAIAAKLALEGNLGAGNDTLSVNLDQEILSKGKVEMAVNGGGGNDTWNLSANEVRSRAKLQASFEGGGGDDTLQTFLGDPIDEKAHVQIFAAGGGGNDTLNVDATTFGTGANIAEGAKLQVHLDGGAGADTLNATYDGNVEGMLQLQLNGGGAGDTVGVTATTNVTGKGKVQAQVNGDNGNDNLTLNLTSTGSTRHVTAAIDGGAGFDTCVATPNVKKKNCEA